MRKTFAAAAAALAIAGTSAATPAFGGTTPDSTGAPGFHLYDKGGYEYSTLVFEQKLKVDPNPYGVFYSNQFADTEGKASGYIGIQTQNADANGDRLILWSVWGGTAVSCSQGGTYQRTCYTTGNMEDGSAGAAARITVPKAVNEMIHLSLVRDDKKPGWWKANYWTAATGTAAIGEIQFGAADANETVYPDMSFVEYPWSNGEICSQGPGSEAYFYPITGKLNGVTQPSDPWTSITSSDCDYRDTGASIQGGMADALVSP